MGGITDVLLAVKPSPDNFYGMPEIPDVRRFKVDGEKDPCSEQKKYEPFIKSQNKYDAPTLIDILFTIDNFAPISKLQPNSINNLCTAYDIANKNSTKENKYINDFYENLNNLVNNQPDKISQWARTIVEKFKEKTIKGYLDSTAFEAVS